MFYITTHTITKNQFADNFTEHGLPNKDPKMENENNVFTIDQYRLAEKCDDLHTIVVANGLRYILQKNQNMNLLVLINRRHHIQIAYVISLQCEISIEW